MNRLIFLLIIIGFVAGVASAQEGSANKSAGRAGIDRDRLNSVMGKDENNANEVDATSPRSPAESEHARKLEITREMSRLDEASAAMLAATKTEPTNLKQLTEMAGKVAKSSRHLRQVLNIAESKIKPSIDPQLRAQDRQTELKRLAEMIGDLVKAIRAEQDENTVDARRTDQTRDRLEMIESYANETRALIKER